MAYTDSTLRTYRQTYSTGRGSAKHDALHISWAEVEEILGHGHEGEPADDAALVAFLLEQGAPEWVKTASGWTDENGWGLIGPEREI